MGVHLELEGLLFHGVLDSRPISSSYQCFKDESNLFATRLNKKLPLYVSPIPDEKALTIHAMSMN